MKKNIKFRSQSTYDYRKTKYPMNNDPSMTIPGETLSIQDIIKNFVKGGTLPPGNQPQYLNGGLDDEPPMLPPDFDLDDYSQRMRSIQADAIERKRQAKTKKTEGDGPKGAEEPQGGSAADDSKAKSDPRGPEPKV